MRKLVTRVGQPLFLDEDVQIAIRDLSQAGTSETLGRVYTRSEIVNFILDLVGYTPDKPLYEHTILEPSFGAGSFLAPIIERLIASWRSRASHDANWLAIKDSIRAVELHKATFEETKAKVAEILRAHNAPKDAIEALTNAWLLQGDYLTEEFENRFDFVVGNPPYIRLENIPSALLQHYRSTFHTMFDRADIYIPFIEKSLSLLENGGHLGFICADRWIKNKYGGPLRKFVSEQFHLRAYIGSISSEAFKSEVSAYPAIFVISTYKEGPTHISHAPRVDTKALKKLSSAIISNNPMSNDSEVYEIRSLPKGREPWLLESPERLNLIRRLEETFPLLEDAGIKVGIGVATGADNIFIQPYHDLPIEPDRKIRLVTRKDLNAGHVQWGGLAVINPFNDDGEVINLDDYPLLSAYIHKHKAAIMRRNVAKRSPNAWFRTIDRIYSALLKEPKLLIPDIGKDSFVALEHGELYPHHNLYYITSSSWNLRALQVFLNSRLVRLFIKTYSTQMRGGFYRFQAQYLRRLRIPLWHTVPPAIQKILLSDEAQTDTSVRDEIVAELLRLSADERKMLKHFGG